MRCAAIVLAAGASSRLGEPKQLAMVGGERLLARAVREAREAGCRPVMVVVAAPEMATYCWPEGVPEGVVVVLNLASRTGMAGSVEVGLEAIGNDVAGVVLMTCDMPGVTAAHLRQLMEEEGRVTASGYAGRRGVPAYFPAAEFGRLRGLSGDKGARELLVEQAVVELAGGEFDVDTPGDLESARVAFG